MRIFRILRLSLLCQRSLASLQGHWPPRRGFTGYRENAVKLLLFVMFSTIAWFAPSYALKAAHNEVDGGTAHTTVIFLPLISNAQASESNDPSSLPERHLVSDRLLPMTKGVCAGLFKLEGTEYCTHGPDEPPPGTDISVSTVPMLFAANANASSVQCDGDGVHGNRVQVMYIRAANQKDRYLEYRQSIQQWMAEVDDIYNASALETGNTRHIRFVHDANCIVEVINEVIPKGSDESFTTSISAIQARGHNRTDRKYLMFVDAKRFCGIGGMYSDESIEATNRNNIGPAYARIDSGCWGSRVAAHELMHNFGGVQFGAPHSSGGYHCTDEWDIMCYSDAPLHPQMVIRCPNQASENRLDCNHDDYYHTNPPAGSYLATHWNPAFNQFLIWENQPLPTATFSPTPMPAAAPNCTIYYANRLPVSIFDQQTVSATLDIPDVFILTRLRLVNLQIQHTFVSDLEAKLISPQGTSVLLFQKVGTNNRDFVGTWFDDDSALAITEQTPPFTGTYRPAQLLGAFNGERVKGQWTLQITDDALRDAGILTAWGLELCRSFAPSTAVSTPIPSITASATPTPVAEPSLTEQSATSQTTPTPTSESIRATPTATSTQNSVRESSAKLTIIVQVEPKSIQNFRFTINGNPLFLDDAPEDDGDAYQDRFTATLPEGNYVLSEDVPHTWFLTNIGCTLDSAVEMTINNPDVQLNMPKDADVTCTFRNQRNVIIRTQTFEDVNQSQQFEEDEPLLAGWDVDLYSTSNNLLATEQSNSFGKANFNGLMAGSYTVCESMRDGWQPSVVHQVVAGQETIATADASCYPVTLAPGLIAIARFANVQTQSEARKSSKIGAGRAYMNENGIPIEVIPLPDVTDDSAGYDEDILQDRDLNTPVTSWRTFLPIISN